MRLVRLERQQSRVADDIRAALASLGRGSTVVGGIALIGVGTVTDRPVEAVVLLPHGVIIVIGVDLPDPALRLEAPLGAEWKADGWPLVADDDAINPATEALDLSQVCESRIAELVPGTAPVGTIVAVGPYVETVDQPASDLAGPVRVLHPTPTTMLAAAVSLATAHRPRSVDQVRALIRGLAPDAPDFSDEILLGERFSRFSDDTPPESLWDTAPRSPGTLTTARQPAGWRTETPVTPTASGRTQLADPPAAVVETDHVLDHASSGLDHASSAPDHASSGLEPAVVPPEAVVAKPEPESSGPDLAVVEPEQASAEPDLAVAESDPESSTLNQASVEPDHATSALDHANVESEPASVEPDHASSALGHAPSPGLAAETDTAANLAAGEDLGALGIPKPAEPSVPADSAPVKASATASESAILPGTTESAAETDTSASSPPARTLAEAQNKAAATSTATDPAPTQVSAMVSDTAAKAGTLAPAQTPAAAQYTVAAVGATKSAAEPSAANGSVLAQSSVAAQNTTVAPGAAQATGASTAPDAAQKVAATFRRRHGLHGFHSGAHRGDDFEWRNPHRLHEIRRTRDLFGFHRLRTHRDPRQTSHGSARLPRSRPDPALPSGCGHRADRISRATQQHQHRDPPAPDGCPGGVLPALPAEPRPAAETPGTHLADRPVAAVGGDRVAGRAGRRRGGRCHSRG